MIVAQSLKILFLASKMTPFAKTGGLAAYSQGEKQKRLMVRGMQAKFSWKRAAQQYMELNRKATGKGGEDDMK